MNSHHIEREIKLILHDDFVVEDLFVFLSENGFQLSPAGTTQHLDIYMDTGDWRLMRNGLGLRLRRSGDRLKYTLKSTGQMTAGVAVRMEIEETVQESAEEYPGLPESIEERITSLIRGEKLLPRLTITTLRRKTLMKKGDAHRFELAEDSSEFAAAHTIPIAENQFKELEIELIAGSAAALEDLSVSILGRFDLQPSSRSKLETAAAALDLFH